MPRPSTVFDFNEKIAQKTSPSTSLNPSQRRAKRSHTALTHQSQQLGVFGRRTGVEAVILSKDSNGLADVRTFWSLLGRGPVMPQPPPQQPSILQSPQHSPQDLSHNTSQQKPSQQKPSQQKSSQQKSSQHKHRSPATQHADNSGEESDVSLGNVSRRLTFDAAPEFDDWLATSQPTAINQKNQDGVGGSRESETRKRQSLATHFTNDLLESEFESLQPVSSAPVTATRSKTPTKSHPTPATAGRKSTAGTTKATATTPTTTTAKTTTTTTTTTTTAAATRASTKSMRRKSGVSVRGAKRAAQKSVSFSPTSPTVGTTTRKRRLVDTTVADLSFVIVDASKFDASPASTPSEQTSTPSPKSNAKQKGKRQRKTEQDTPSPSPLQSRKSSRRRFPPLEFWRNERVVYSRNPNEFSPSIVGVARRTENNNRKK